MMDMVVGDEIELRGVLVEEREGLTVLSIDEASSHELIGSGNNVIGVRAGIEDLALAATAESAEPYEGMLITVYNTRVLHRGVAQGESLYYLGAEDDSMLATDAGVTALPPDSTFFVREGDRLGLITGLVEEMNLVTGSGYVLRPRSAADYWFIAGNQVLATWGGLKRMHE
jgi:hypothetical protein